MLMGTWRVTGSSWLQKLTVRNIFVFNSMPSCNQIVGIHDRMGMKFTSKCNGTMLVKSQLFKLPVIKGMLSETGPTNTQKDDLHGAAVPPPTAVQASCLHRVGAMTCVICENSPHQLREGGHVGGQTV
eukprot:1137537-Pelagomonas_calceolata.AAC.2